MGRLVGTGGGRLVTPRSAEAAESAHFGNMSVILLAVFALFAAFMYALMGIGLALVILAIGGLMAFFYRNYENLDKVEWPEKTE